MKQNKYRSLKSLAAIAVLLCGPLANVVHGEAAPSQGDTNFGLCAGCHGKDGEGNKDLHAPKLAGLSAGYVERQLLNYRNGLRGASGDDPKASSMRAMAMSLADEDAVENVSSYVGKLAHQNAKPTIVGDASAGQIYWAVCSGCHGVKGQGNPQLGAPRLQGMSDWYLLSQLKAYRTGTRGSHPSDKLGKQMAPMAKMLPDENSLTGMVAFIIQLEE